MQPIELDGSRGEGGGQIVRSALTLSMLTGRPCLIRNLRARRERPGLQPQHLTAVQAAAAICDGRLEGAELHSQTLRFQPGAVRPGDYRFDIGTAGATTLLLQTLYLPLALTGAPSTLVLSGGTHVPLSPCFHYLDLAWQPLLAEMGLDIELLLERAGFYPPGGGELRALIEPARQLAPLTRLERGDLLAINGISAVARLPASIAERQRTQALDRVQALAPSVAIELEFMPAVSPGSLLLLLAHFEHGQACFFALGERGKPAEQVADEAADALFDFLASGAALDRYIVDQLLLPLALAQGESALSTASISPHLLTNSAVIQAFLPVAIDIDGEPGSPGVVRIRPAGGPQLPLPLPAAAARPQSAAEWNVVVSVRGQHFNQVRRLLARLGRVRRTQFFNVLTLTVGDQREFLEALAGELALAPALREGVGHVTPVTVTFAFETVAHFETKVREAALALLPALAGKRFHVRLHRRGFKGRLDSQVEERQLADALLPALQERGTPAQVSFDDPDAILIVEIVGQRAGLAVWNREDFARYPFIQPN